MKQTIVSLLLLFVSFVVSDHPFYVIQIYKNTNCSGYPSEFHIYPVRNGKMCVYFYLVLGDITVVNENEVSSVHCDGGELSCYGGCSGTQTSITMDECKVFVQDTSTLIHTWADFTDVIYVNNGTLSLFWINDIDCTITNANVIDFSLYRNSGDECVENRNCVDASSIFVLSEKVYCQDSFSFTGIENSEIVDAISFYLLAFVIIVIALSPWFLY